MPERKTRNRPKIFEKRMELRLTPEERKKFKEASDKQRITLSQWMRLACWMVINEHDGKVQF